MHNHTGTAKQIFPSGRQDPRKWYVCEDDGTLVKGKPLHRGTPLARTMMGVCPTCKKPVTFTRLDEFDRVVKQAKEEIQTELDERERR